MWTYISSSEMYHHGIKGQRWGVRRFQNKDGSLTSAGKKRYDDGNGSKPKKELKVPENGKKSTHRLKLEEKYKAKGMSEKEAEQAAARRIRGEKYALGAATVTLAACVAYNKYKEHNVDKIISSNKEFHRILSTDKPDAPIRKGPRYVAYTKGDRQKYRGLYGHELQSQQKLHDLAKKFEPDFDPNNPTGLSQRKIYDMTINMKQDVKVASEKRARDTFEKLYKNDPEFRKNFKNRLEMNQLNFIGKGKLGKGDTIGKIIKNETLTDKELRSKGYDMFNIMLVDSDPKGRANANKFYNSLKEQGIQAVRDMNDKKYSGYKTKNPIILFDGDFDHSKRVLSDSEIKKDLNKALVKIYGGTGMGIGAAYVAAFSAEPVLNSRSLEKQAILYQREHPNSKMSKKEIMKMLAKQNKE